jgi:hypothetical protein
MTPTQFLALIGLIKDETAPNGNTKTRIGDAILESSKQANTYSTDETVIGTWIDGKPIYRKVIVGDVSTGDVVLIGETILEITEVKGMVKTSVGNTWVNINSNTPFAGYYTTAGDSYIVETDVSDGNGALLLIFRAGAGSPIVNKNYKIIVEYTKTTDSILE